jgi:hypothetical protein
MQSTANGISACAKATDASWPGRGAVARRRKAGRDAARLWALVRAVAVLLSVLFAIPVSSALAECNEQLQAEIVDRYARTYHRHWGEQMRRKPIEILMVGLARDSRAILKKYDNPPCRFTVIVGRELPREPWGCPCLAPDAKAIGAIVEFAAEGPEICVGFNSEYEVAGPIEDPSIYPHEERPVPGNPLGTTYAHYAMRCIGEGEEDGRRYLYY